MSLRLRRLLRLSLSGLFRTRWKISKESDSTFYLSLSMMMTSLR
jgi:hypothetical protein